jgi:hypothetical protein
MQINFQISKFLKNFSYFLYLVIILSSCGKKVEESILPNSKSKNKNVSNKVSILNVVKTEDECLSFPSTKLMYQFLDSIKTLSNTDRINLEKSLNFQSMHQILFYTGLEAQGKYLDSLMENQIEINGNSPYVKSYPNVFYQETDTSSLAMNIFLGDMAMIVNKNGLVKIGNYFFQYTRDYYKMLESNDKTKVTQLMNAVDNDENNKIRVQYVGGRNKAFSYYSSCGEAGLGVINCNKIYKQFYIKSYNLFVF